MRIRVFKTYENGRSFRLEDDGEDSLDLFIFLYSEKRGFPKHSYIGKSAQEVLSLFDMLYVGRQWVKIIEEKKEPKIESVVAQT